MSTSEAKIGHVSDTALMVAACRALETAREDGLVRDPFAQRLAGERGMNILKEETKLEMLSFGLGLRSKLLDELVMEAVNGRGITTVFSLGAGLDTRPWRLDIPSHVRWIEVDFPDMLEYKYARMAGEQPKCRLEHVAVDLTDAAARHDLIEQARQTPSMVITEGVLMYLPKEAVDGLARDAADANVACWLLEITSSRFKEFIRTDLHTAIQQVRAPGHMSGGEIIETLSQRGWKSARYLNYSVDGRRVAMPRMRKLAELMRAQLPPGATPPQPVEDGVSGIHMMSRA